MMFARNRELLWIFAIVLSAACGAPVKTGEIIGTYQVHSGDTIDTLTLAPNGVFHHTSIRPGNIIAIDEKGEWSFEESSSITTSSEISLRGFTQVDLDHTRLDAWHTAAIRKRGIVNIIINGDLSLYYEKR